ncbi:hypothetical protein CK203_090374 [Vitis vinifera]|uniref:Uncharacterized protein n=1 Tax=Vitis vinifera TaxID=29760 RepID=A0A438C7U4_VITVI|nr:hypothetical protein CK203_090374 [Vitis vinifera]
MARTRGLSPHLLRTAKGVCERSQVQVLLQSLRRQGQILLRSSPSAKAAGKTIPYQVRRSAIAEENQGGELRTIDLTEQSPEPSQFHQPVQTPVPSPVPSPSPLPVPSPVPSPAPSRKISGASSATSRAPNSSGNTSGRTLLRLSSIQSKARACPIIPAVRRYHMEQLLAPRDFFYPRIATDFYQSMTTKEVRNPTLIHFTIEGRHGIISIPATLDPKKGSSPGSPVQDVRRILLGPHHLIMAALLYFEEKVHKKKLQEQIAFPSSSHGCYAKFWSIWDTPLSLN